MPSKSCPGMEEPIPFKEENGQKEMQMKTGPFNSLTQTYFMPWAEKSVIDVCERPSTLRPLTSLTVHIESTFKTSNPAIRYS
jgi:hypothetical protein